MKKILNDFRDGPSSGKRNHWLLLFRTERATDSRGGLIFSKLRIAARFSIVEPVADIWAALLLPADNVVGA